MKKYLILENIRSAHNVGAMFRTADGAGVSKIFLCGYTPTPTDRFGRVQEEIKKTSLGASETMDWEKVNECVEVAGRLHAEGVNVVAIEQTESSQTLGSLNLNGDTAYVLGNEIDGVSAEVLEAADLVVQLPMLGDKESLNVSTTAGIVLYYGLV